MRRLLTALGGLILLGLLGIGGLFWFSLPSRDQELSIPGLSAPVDITYDPDGIPRIRASTLRDAAAALGFVHARDRLFQMELMRRAASGRLAELFGKAALPMDRQARTLGLARRSAEDFERLPQDGRALLEAYASGVNAWISRRGRFAAPEFLVFGAPEPWRPLDSLLWGKSMGMLLSVNWRMELARWRLEGTMPREAILALWPDQNQAGRPDAPVRQAGLRPDLLRAWADSIPAFPPAAGSPPRASNEWAVDGRHSATGAPLLAGDPHLGFGFPSIWYLARIDTPEGMLAGATSPGVPLVVLGHNGHIAWTFTTNGADVQDVFIETPVGADRYETPDGPQPFAVREERIKVRNAPDEVLRVRETRHGPVISDLLGPNAPLMAVAMANLAPGDTAAEGLFLLNRARSVAEAGRAASVITSPVQNMLVADRQTIGLFVTGRVPIRKSGDGAMPVKGADGAHDWIGWASGEQLPHYVAPESGILVNANDRVAPADFPVFLGRDWFSDWRARRIRTLLGGGGRQTLDAFQRMQADVTSEMARALLPDLLAAPAPDGIAGKARALLAGWDGTMRMDAPQPLIFEAWIGALYQALASGAGGGGAVAPLPEFLPEALQRNGAAGEITKALRVAVDGLAQQFGTNPASWRWGIAHRAVFAHPVLSRIPVLDRLGRITIEVPGSETTVFATANPPGQMQATLGPEFRGIYDLADLDRSRFMMAPGQSGNPFSPGARAFLTRWRDGETITLGPTPRAVAGRIRLSP